MRAALVIPLAVVGLAGCGGSGSSSSTTTAVSGASATQKPGAPCTKVPVPAPPGPQHLRAPKLALDPAHAYAVTVATNCGTFAFKLDVRQSPKTAASFYSLVKRGFFDGLTFHRVAAGFVIQGGDPSGDGTGGPGYTVVEPPPSSTQYVSGDVAMAKTQAQPRGASGSQFFIVTAANATQSNGLTPDYAVVGKVVRGMKVVDAIGALPTSPPQDGAPSPRVVMSSVTVRAR